MQTTRNILGRRGYAYRFKRFIQNGLERIGWRFVRVDRSFRSGFDAQTAFLGASVSCPYVIFDVGASKGVTVAEYRARFPEAHIHAFEPFAEAFERLRAHCSWDTNIFLHQLAITDTNDERTLHVQPSTDSNSLLPSASVATQQASSEVLVHTTTLDTFCAQQAITKIDLLKMDIQGAELSALRGAERLLREGRVHLLYLEVQFISLYEGQAWASEIMEYLRGYGYSLVDLYDRRYAKDGSLKWADALFVKR